MSPVFTTVVESFPQHSHHQTVCLPGEECVCVGGGGEGGEAISRVVPIPQFAYTADTQ